MLELIIIPTLVFCAFIALAKFAFSREPNFLKRLPKAFECFLQQVILNIGCLVITMLLVVGLGAAALTDHQRILGMYAGHSVRCCVPVIDDT